MPAVNGVGKPCAGEPHARIDGRELETERISGHGHGEEPPHGKPCDHQRLRALPPDQRHRASSRPSIWKLGEALKIRFVVWVWWGQGWAAAWGREVFGFLVVGLGWVVQAVRSAAYPVS